jgi:hypothetical protein
MLETKRLSIDISIEEYEKLRAIAITEYRSLKLQTEFLIKEALKDCKIDTSVVDKIISAEKTKNNKTELKGIDLNEIDDTLILLKKAFKRNEEIINEMTSGQRNNLEVLIAQPKKVGQLLYEYLNGNRHFKKEMKQLLSYINEYKNKNNEN